MKESPRPRDNNKIFMFISEFQKRRMSVWLKNILKKIMAENVKFGKKEINLFKKLCTSNRIKLKKKNYVKAQDNQISQN